MKDQTAFLEAYNRLNEAQKKAVDTVEGPVLVVAGPGTGKTHILTLRIANILRTTTDTAPENILVLTFTDSAARTVSRRLAVFIGEEAARKVNVFTFHGFAGEILRTHPEAFPEYTDRRLMGEVEQVLVWRAVLENAGDTKLRTPKSPFHYLKDLSSLEDSLTRECITTDAYRAWLDTEEQMLKDDPKLVYARGAQMGELNAAGQKRAERLIKGREAADLIDQYRALKDELGVYGYTDVLRFATDALKEDEALRADLQEKYQYVLADEHQDANALQHALLDALAFDEHPNLFIVGDEKQAVYGFQGADITHFETFTSRYPRTTVIPLTENYRSYQDILDLSHGLLGALPSATGGHVELSGFRGTGGTAHVLLASDALAERDQVATLIEQAITEGVAPHEIAVITLKNKTADLFALHLRARGIPALRAGDIDLEGRPSIRFLLSLMHAIADPNAPSMLREALLAPWWEETVADRAKFLRTHGDWELEESLAEAFPRIAQIVIDLRTKAQSVPPLNAFSYILADSGARAYFLSSGEGVSEDIPLVRQLMTHIEELARRDPNATFAEVMEGFGKAREHEIGAIKSSRTQHEGQVTVITAHKAKGMEFERVFVTALSTREWEGRGKSSLIPSPFSVAREREELIRLFYVALTRAKDALILSYPRASSEGKDEAPMSLLPQGLPRIEGVPEDPLPLLHATVEAPALVCELTRAYLAHEGLSPSAFNEYLESPSVFFAKRVLRLREPESRAIVLGNAVHAAIAAYLRAKSGSEEEREGLAQAELARSFRKSLLPRGDTFTQLERQARTCLTSYLRSAMLEREAVAIEETFRIERNVNGHEVLLKGKVDAVFKGVDGECIVDFKTSSTLDKKDQEKFERQLAFYDLLLRENGHTTTSALIVQVGDDITEHPVALNADTRASLASCLAEVLEELISGHWRVGEQSPYDELLSLFREV
ncbi:MAG TPA: ATP-dependent DNA helicase [Candidatus Paceibacterota bacterium]|nr:ATP-dependent DNA helicase [Candidatus Paceibacterota bacterium]